MHYPFAVCVCVCVCARVHMCVSVVFFRLTLVVVVGGGGGRFVRWTTKNKKKGDGYLRCMTENCFKERKASHWLKRKARRKTSPTVPGTAPFHSQQSSQTFWSALPHSIAK